MPSQRPPGRGNSSARGPRPTPGHAGARRPGPATGGPANRRPGPQARREAKPYRAPTTASPTGARSPQPLGEDRLQKILAHAGVGSRRACEELILQGRVTVGGQVVKELGTKVDLGKIGVAVDGQKIQAERLVYFAVNKPKGYVSTNNDPSGRPLVLDLLPGIAQRVYTIGRLDEMSVGLMLVTNDGELANKLAHPKFGVEKLYRVIVAGTPERDTLNQLTEGIWLAEGKVRAKRVRAVAKKGEATILELVLAEGKNREVRRMLAKLGHKVMSLTRVAVGPITLKGLGAGDVRPLTGREVDLLRRVAAGEPVPMPWTTFDRRPSPGGDRPRRPVGASPRGMRDRRDEAGPGPGPGAGPRRFEGGPAARHDHDRDQDRPRGPGYRAPGGAGDRRPGPAGRPQLGLHGGTPRPDDRRPMGGPPRRPGMFQAAHDDSIGHYRDDRRPGPGPGARGGPRPGGPRPPYRQDGPPGDARGGPRPGGPRPYQRQDGPTDGTRGGPRPYQRQDGPQGGPRSYQRQDGPAGVARGGPRPGGPRPDQRQDGPPRPHGRQDGPPRPHGRQDGPQGRPPYRTEGDARPPRPGQRPGGDRRFAQDDRRDGPPPQRNQGPTGPRPRPGGDRRFAEGDRRDGPPQRNQGPSGPRPRPGGRPPAPGSFEPRRKVIGLAATPPPEAQNQDTGGDRPASRLKRPAPRGGAPGAGRPMPKRRPGRRDED